MKPAIQVGLSVVAIVGIVLLSEYIKEKVMESDMKRNLKDLEENIKRNQAAYMKRNFGV